MEAHTNPEPNTTPQVSERSVAFFADRRASTLLLKETVIELIQNQRIAKGYVDISSLPGLAIADAFVASGVPFESIEFGQDRVYETLTESTDRDTVREPYGLDDEERIRAAAHGALSLEVDELASVNANLALVPAPVGPGEALIDFSPQTVTGVVLQQASEQRLPLLIINTPERGLTVDDRGLYIRGILHVASPEAETESNQETL